MEKAFYIMFSLDPVTKLAPLWQPKIRFMGDLKVFSFDLLQQMYALDAYSIELARNDKSNILQVPLCLIIGLVV